MQQYLFCKEKMDILWFCLIMMEELGMFFAHGTHSLKYYDACASGVKSVEVIQKVRGSNTFLYEWRENIIFRHLCLIKRKMFACVIYTYKCEKWREIE